MINIIESLGAGAIGGGLTGGLITWWVGRRRRRQSVAVTPLPQLGTYPCDDGLEQAAVQWAEAHGQPAAAPLVANKLRLAHRLAVRRSGGWGR